MQRRTFDEIEQLHTRAKSAGLDAAKGDLATFSDYMQGLDPGSDWSAGRGATGLIGDFSRGVDSLIASTGAAEIGGNIGSFLGSGIDTLVSNPDGKYANIGQSVGESLPRGLVDTGLVLGGGAVTAASGGTLAPLGIGMMGAGIADAGVKGYADTGSVAAGAANAALMGVAPYVGAGGAALGMKLLPKAVAGSALAKAGAATAGAEVAQIGAGMLTAPFQGQDILSGENLAANVIGSLAFLPITVKQGFGAYKSFKATADAVGPTPVMDGSINEPGQFFDYLVGKNNLTDLDQNSSIAQALKLTGLTDEAITGGMKLDSDAVAKRVMGRDVFQKAVDESVGVEREKLVAKAAQLLQEDPKDMGYLVQLMRISNEFAKPMKPLAFEDAGYVLPGTPIDPKGNGKPFDPKSVGKGKKGKPETNKFGEVQETMDLGVGVKVRKSGVVEQPGIGELFRFVKGPVQQNADGRFSVLGGIVVPNSGLVHQNRFLSGTQMPKQVFELVKKVYPEVFEGENINVNKLGQLEKERPMFETHVYGQAGKLDSVKAEYDRIRGELDIAKSSWNPKVKHWDDNEAWLPRNEQEVVELKNEAIKVGMPEKDAELYAKMLFMRNKGEDQVKSGEPKATSYYNTISPFDTQKYPVVRIDVTLPISKEAGAPPKRPEDNPIKWRQDDLHENLPNTLGWAMVQFVPHPQTGETVMFVAEQQSRWGQEVAKSKAITKKTGAPLEPHHKNYGVDHPLLDLQHKLVLKAAMDEARKRGVTKMVVSDGETAMMTERHDTASRSVIEMPGDDLIQLLSRVGYSDAKYSEYAGREKDAIQIPNQDGRYPYYPVEVAVLHNGKWRLTADAPTELRAKAVTTVDQEGGMRQHYDSVLQSAAGKLTRDQGVMVDMGVHKNQHVSNNTHPETQARLDAGEVVPESEMKVETVYKGSPVFKNPDGSPKATATGKMYDLTKQPASDVRYMNVAQNPDGTYSAASVKAALEKLTAEAGGDHVAAYERLTNMVKGGLSEELPSSQGAFVQSGQLQLLKLFKTSGLDPALAEGYVGMVGKVLARLEQMPGSRFGDLSDPELAARLKASGMDPATELNGLKGVAVGDRWGKLGTIIGLSSDPDVQKFGSKKSAAFDAVMVAVHESVHGLQHNVEAPNSTVAKRRLYRWNEMQDYAATLSPEEMQVYLAAAHKEFSKNVKTLPEWYSEGFGQRVAKMSDPKERALEFATEYSTIMAMSLWGKPNQGGKLQSFVRFLPEPIRNFFTELFSSTKDVLRMVIAYGASRGFSKDSLDGMRIFHDNTLEFLNADPVIEQAKSSVASASQAGAAMEAGDIGGSQIRFSKVIPVMDEYQTQMRQLSEKNQREMGWLGRNVFQHQQNANNPYYKATIPAYSNTISLLTTMDPLAVRLQHQIRAPFMVTLAGGLLRDLMSTKNSHLSVGELAKKTMIGIASTGRVKVALNNAMLKSNELVARIAAQKGTQEPMPTFEHPEIQETMKGLPAEQVAAAKHVFESYLEANKTAGAFHMSMEKDRISYFYAKYLHGHGIAHEQALPYAQMLTEALISRDMRGLPPELGAMGPDGFTFVPANEGVVASMKHWENIQGKYYDMVDQFNRPYFTELRTGRWFVRYDSGQVDENGQPITGGIATNSRTELKAIYKHLAEQKMPVLEEVDRLRKDQTGFGNMGSSGLDKASELVKAHYEYFLGQQDAETAAWLKQEFMPEEPLVQTSDNMKQYMAERQFKPGRELLDMITGQDAYSSLIARKVANHHTRLEANWQMQHPSWEVDPTLKAEVTQFKNSVLSEGRQAFKPFRKAVTFMTLGANVSSAMIDASQPWTMGVWKITEEIGAAKAIKLVGRAYVEAFKGLDKLAPDFKELLVRADNEGLLKTGSQMADMYSADEHASFNVQQAGANRTMLNVEELVTNPTWVAGKVFEQIGALGNKTLDVAMTPHRMSSQINNKTMLWTGLQLAKEKGLTGRAAQDYAINIMQVTNVAGSRAAHSSFKLKAGQANGIVEAATLMTNYPIAAISQMVGSWTGQLKKMGLPADVRRRSREAFIGQALTQFAMAGALGFGMDALFRLVKPIFGIDPEDAIRRGLAEIDESGTLGDVLLHGIASQVSGIDLASRYSLSGLGGLNPYTGWESKGMFGAGGGTIQALYNAPSQIKKGEASKLQLIPVGIRRLIGAVDDTGAVDNSGQQVIDPTQAEKMMMMAGFKPKRLTDLQNQRQMLRGVTERQTQEDALVKKQMSEQLVAGDIPGVLKMVKERVSEELKYLTSKGMPASKVSEEQRRMVREELIELVDYTVQKTLPLDPMMSGSASAAPELEQTARGYGKMVPRVSEVRRQQLKEELLRPFGIRLPRSANRPQRVDEVIQQNPMMTRSNAVKVADR